MFGKKTKSLIALVLTLCMVTQFVPLTFISDGLSAVSASVAELSAPPVNDLEWTLEEGKGKTSLQDGEWLYILLPEYQYAIVTGHTDPSAAQLSVPVTLGGADTVGLAADALKDHLNLTALSLPGNLRAIGENAVPRGTTIEGYNGSYGQRWAKSHRYSFRNLSGFDFMSGVTDYSDIQAGTFRRISDEEVHLRRLEAGRLQTGSLFFLPDPANLYRISYYRVVSISEADEDGFVTVACETPAMGEIFHSFSVEDAELVPDPSTFEAAEGVEIYTGTPRAFGDTSEEGSLTFSLMDFSFSKSVNEHLKISGGANIGLSGKISGAYTDTKTTSSGSITLKGSVNFKLDASTNNLLISKDKSDELDKMKKAMKEAYENSERYKEPYSVTLGRMCLFTAYGVLSFYASFGVYVEVSGSLEGSASLSYTFTFFKDENGTQKIDNEGKGKRDCQLKATGKAKAGVMLSLEASFLGFITVIKFSILAGFEATAAYQLSNTRAYDMLDTIELSLDFVIQASLGIGIPGEGIGKAGWKFTPLKQGFGAEITLLRLEIAKGHLHMMAYDEAGNEKDQCHFADDCPYGKLSAVFAMPFLSREDENYNWPVDVSTGSNPGRKATSLEAFDVLEEPEEPDLSEYGMCFEGWYMDSAYTEPAQWPYTMGNHSVTFYGKAVNRYIAYYYTTDGLEVTDRTVCGEGKTFNLPGSANGYNITGWYRLSGPDVNKALSESYDAAGDLQVMPDHNVYYLACCTNDVEAYFYNEDQVIRQDICLTADRTLNAPDVSGSPRFTLTGWKDINGKSVTFPMELAYGAEQKQHYYAVWSYNGTVTEPAGTALSISGNGTSWSGSSQSGDSYFYFGSFNDNTMTCSVTGYNSTQTRTYYDSEGKQHTETYTVYPENISIPGSHRVTDSDGNEKRYTVTHVSGMSGWSTLIDVYVPSSVRTIGSSCFANNPKLYSIRMGGTSVTSLPSGFASNCPNLTSVSVPDCLTSIGSNAFANCTSITSVRAGIPIGGAAFSGCSSLAEITLNGGVTSIGSSAFSGCTSLTGLRIPDSVQSIGNSFLSGCLNLEEIDFDGRPGTITSGMMDIGTGSHLKRVIIGAGVINIGDSAFANNGHGFAELEFLKIDEHVQSVGSNAFKGSGLRSLEIGGQNMTIKSYAFTGNRLEELTVTHGILSSNAFANCTGLKNVTLGVGVAVGNCAFENCTSLDDPELGGAVSIGDCAFRGCTGLVTIRFPDTVTSYGTDVISGCLNLEWLEIGNGCKVISNSNYSVSRHFFIGNGSKLRHLEIHDGVTAIEQYEFANYGNSMFGFLQLSEIILPKSLKKIGYKAFYKAGNDSLVIEGDITDWGSEAFGYSGIKSLTINGNIGDSAFAGAVNLEEVYISGTGSIGQNAFGGCTALKKVTIEEGLKTVGSNAFKNCGMLEAITFPNTVTGYGSDVISGCLNLKRLVIGGGCKRIDNRNYSVSRHFFIGAGSKLEYLEICDGVTEIEQYEFANYGNSMFGFTQLSEIILPESLTSVGHKAFYKAGKGSLTIKGDITSWGSEAFACSGITELDINGNIGASAFANSNSLTKVTIRGFGSIGQSAFSGCAALKTVEIEDGLRAVGNNAFYNCSSLQALAFPDTVTSYGTDIISGCLNLEQLVIGGGCKILANGNYSVSRHFFIGKGAKLKRLEIREGVTTIEQYEFANYGNSMFGFTQLSEIILPESLISIGYKAFYKASCDKLIVKGDVISWGSEAFADGAIKSLEIYGNIGPSAFANCKTLRNLLVGGNGTVIHNAAFSGCTALTAVTLLDGVVSVGNNAFSNCSVLQALEFPDSVTSYGTDLISGCMELKRLVIGGGCKVLANGNYSVSRHFFIGNGAKLSHLEIREGVTTIEQYEFANYGNGMFGFTQLSEIILPESLVSVGHKAFYKAGNGSLTIKGNITAWGSEAFAYSGITKLDINGNIGASAFANARNLRNVTIRGNGNIGQSAFSGCTSLLSAEIEYGLKTVGTNAFSNCSALQALEFPDSVTSYGTDIISGCLELKRLVIGGGCKVLANGNYSVSRHFFIGNGAKLKYLEIREGVTSIEQYEFANYGNNMFGFTQLSEIILPESLVNVGYKAFYKAGNGSLTIKGNITAWGSEAFAYSGIEYLNINGNVGGSAFKNCTSLTEVHISGEGTIGGSAFSGCTSLASVVIEEGVTAVGGSAFANCRSLESLQLPDSITSYGSGMISGCTGLKSIVIGGGCAGLTCAPFFIGAGSSLEYLEIREGVTSLGDYVLANASQASASSAKKHEQLNTLILPDSLTAIGNGNLNMLPALHTMVSGSALTNIGSGTALATPELTIRSGEFNACLNDLSEANEGVTYLFGGYRPYFSLTAMARYGEETAELFSGEVPLHADMNLPEEDADGWQIMGWYTDEACRQPLTATEMPGRDLTVYAKMAPLVRVTWMVNIRTEGAAESEPGWYEFASSEVSAGTRIANPAVAAENRRFAGWFRDAELTTRWYRENRIPETGLTLYGYFEPLYDAVFMLVYPDGTVEPYTAEAYGDAITVTPPGDPGLQGYSLAGWYREEELIHPWTDGQMTESGMILYGKLRRVTAGGIYRGTEGGLALVSYAAEEDEGTEVYLPAAVNGIPVTTIDAGAFSGTAITMIYLPDSLETVDEHAFDGAEKLSILRISAANCTFCTRDGVLYSKDLTTLVKYPQNKPARDFTIPASVTALAPGAFRDAGRMETVSFPNGLTEIPAEAFSGCSALKSVSLPGNVTRTGAEAFACCFAMTSFSAQGLTEIGDYAIPHSSDLTVTGPTGEGALRDYCLGTEEKPADFRIAYNPCTITLNINGTAYGSFTAEKGVPIDGRKIRTLVEGFSGIGSISGETSSVLEMPNGTIITGWFREKACTNAWNPDTDVPAGNTTIYAKSIPQYTWETADFVTGQTADEEGNTIDVTVQGIRLTGYYGKGGDVILPDRMSGKTVMGLGGGMLSHANGPVASVAIGSHVIEIDDTAFNDAEGNPFAGTIYTDPESWAETWAAGQEYSGEDRMYTLSYVTGGSSLPAVQAACGTTIRIGVPVRTGAEFIGWYTDAALTQPAELENGVLFIMPAADTVLYAGWNAAGEEPEYSFLETASGTITITGYLGNDRIIEVPDEINGLAVTAIGERAFAGLSLTRIILPDTVQTTGAFAFADTPITSIDLGGTVTIGEYAFDGCRKLSSITMTAAEHIGEGAFNDCATLPEIVLPGTLKTIGSYAFSGCNGLTSAALPDGVRKLEAHTFDTCRSLKTVMIGRETETVDAGAFWCCPALNSISVHPENERLKSTDGVLYSFGGTVLIAYPQGKTEASFAIPDSVTEIADSAFANAQSLKTILLPESLCYIGGGAFRSCTGLTSFSLPDNCVIPYILPYTFYGCTGLTSVVLNSHVRNIADYTFGMCSGLRFLTIRGMTEEIGDQAVGLADHLTIIGTAGSAADLYAGSHGFTFTDPDAGEIQALSLTGETVMQRGETQTLTITAVPEESPAYAGITWTSSNPECVRVDNGYIRALSGGTAVITATARNGVSAEVTIEVQVAVRELVLSPEEITAARGETLQAECGIYPASATNKTLIWTSSNETAATVDDKGVITMTGEGNAVITAAAHNGTVASMNIQVYNAVEELIPEVEAYTLRTVGPDSAAMIHVSVLPEDATWTDLIWSSSDENVATVENGLVTAVNAGSAVITATAPDPCSVSADITITVERFDLADAAEVEILSETTYNGTEQTPAVRLTADGKQLIQDVDFMVTSGTVKDAGEYTITLEGTGLYQGEIIAEAFTVGRAAPVITWNGNSIIPLGTSPDLSLATVAPDECEIHAILYKETEDGRRLPAEDGIADELGRYVLVMTVDETENQEGATAEQALTAGGILLSTAALTIAAGQQVQIAAAMSDDAEGLTWSSSDEEIVTVDQNGRILGVSAGEAVVILSCSAYSASCPVTVKETMNAVLTLPAGTKTIEAEAFEGTAVQVVILTPEIERIGSMAFGNAVNLRQIICPDTAFEMDTDALAGSSGAVILCPADSAAEAFCRSTGVPYVYID